MVPLAALARFRLRRASSVRNAVCRQARRLGRDARGNALVEAALVFPILISLFLGISEFSEALTVSRRVEAAAGTSADLVARLKTVTTDDLTQIKPMIDKMLSPFPTAPLGLVITSVVADDDNETTVAWSHAEGAGVSARAEGAPVALPPGLTEPNTSVIFAEVRYTFHSTLATLIAGGVPMQAEAYMRPRLAAQVEKTD
jgi:Flp pilus assembly protein TadG